MPPAWTADRLGMGSRGYLAWLLGQGRKAAVQDWANNNACREHDNLIN